MRRLVTILSATCIILSADVSSATELNFNGYGAGGVSSGTANRAVGGDGVSIGNGWTPNIVVSYDTLLRSDYTPASRGIGTWGGGYGDLDTVAFPQVPPGDFGNYVGSFWFIPDPGYSVRINSFQMGGYSFTDQPNQPVFIRTESGQVLWDGSGLVLGANQTHSDYAPNVTSSEKVYVIFGDNWNTGIDNINFDQVAVPEPASVVLATLGVLAAAAYRRRRFLR